MAAIDCGRREIRSRGCRTLCAGRVLIYSRCVYSRRSSGSGVGRRNPGTSSPCQCADCRQRGFRSSGEQGDNAWLAESLGRRIKELTRYPSSARLNGSEGKVVLRVVLRADGHLVDVVVHRSSGHEVLDRAAMETVRLACPIHMKQALSAAEVAVYVPIVYSLAG